MKIPCSPIKIPALSYFGLHIIPPDEAVTQQGDDLEALPSICIFHLEGVNLNT